MSIKQKILNWREEMKSFREKELFSQSTELENLSKEVRHIFKKLQDQDYDGDDAFNRLNERMNDMNARIKVLEREIDEKMRERFKVFSETYPAIFDMFIKDDVDEFTLNHVLTTFDRMQRGEISAQQGQQRGLNYMQKRYKLPEDFFKK